MKKIILSLVLFTALFASLSAAESYIPTTVEKNEENWSSMTYENIPILKILDSKYGYIIIYQKHRIGTGTTYIPKNWAKGSPDSPRKLKIRNIKNPQESFMTVIKDDGEFKRVILSIPKSKSSNLWGVSEYNSQKFEEMDKDTLEELDL